MSDRFRPPRSGLDQAGISTLADYAQLTQFAGWHALREHYESQIVRQKQEWGDALFKGDPPESSEVAFRAGFYEGVMAVLDTPSKAETRLTRELQRRKDAA
jgi:hypothetical protein